MIEELVNVADFERAAEEKLDDGVGGYFFGGAGDELTLAENVEAWSLVAEARQYMLSGRTSERYFRAVIRFCERALALDPNFAEAWATIAQARNRLNFDCGFADEDGFHAANRALEDTEVVVWYTFGAHHVVRPEDWPVMPAVSLGFMLKPDGFFDRSPALDVPPSSDASHCHAE